MLPLPSASLGVSASPPAPASHGAAGWRTGCRRGSRTACGQSLSALMLLRSQWAEKARGSAPAMAGALGGGTSLGRGSGAPAAQTEPAHSGGARELEGAALGGPGQPLSAVCPSESSLLTCAVGTRAAPSQPTAPVRPGLPGWASLWAPGHKAQGSRQKPCPFHFSFPT